MGGAGTKPAPSYRPTRRGAKLLPLHYCSTEPALPGAPFMPCGTDYVWLPHGGIRAWLLTRDRRVPLPQDHCTTGQGRSSADVCSQRRARWTANSDQHIVPPPSACVIVRLDDVPEVPCACPLPARGEARGQPPARNRLRPHQPSGAPGPMTALLSSFTLVTHTGSRPPRTITPTVVTFRPKAGSSSVLSHG